MNQKTMLSFSLICLVCLSIQFVIPFWWPSNYLINVRDLRDRWDLAENPVSARIGWEETIDRNLSGWHNPVRELATLIFLYLAGALTMLWAPRRVRLVADELRLDWTAKGRIFIIGIFGILSAITLAFLGFLSMFGAPLSLLLFFLVLLGSWLGWIALSLVFGDWLLWKIGMEKPSPLLSFGLGLLAIQTVGIIPVLGWIFTLLLILLGFGAVLSSKFGGEGGWSLREISNG